MIALARKLSLFLLLAVMPWAANADGLPSRPRFQSVAVVGSVAPDNGIYLASANTFCWSTANVQRFCANGSGNITVNAASSGTTLQVNSGPGAGTSIISLSGASKSAYTQYQGTDAASANVSGYVGINAYLADASLEFKINGRGLSLGPNGNALITAPGSGITLSLLGNAATNSRILDLGGTTTGYAYQQISNTGGNLFFGVDTSVGGVLVTGGGAYGAALGTGNSTSLCLATNNTCRLAIDSAGTSLTMNAGSGAKSLTPSDGSGTLTISGCTTSPTVSYNYSKIGRIVVLAISGNSCTSNSTSFALTGLPAAIAPANWTTTVAFGCAIDNSANVYDTQAFMSISATQITMYHNGSSTGWTAAGNKGICFTNTVITYST